jgi:hypothetical protein
MRTGKHLVDLLSDLTGHEPDWVVFPKDKTGDAFSTAFFGDVRNETIAALMPMELADKDSQNFTINVSEFQIAITVFCRYEDAPTNARPAYRLEDKPSTPHTDALRAELEAKVPAASAVEAMPDGKDY